MTSIDETQRLRNENDALSDSLSSLVGVDDCKTALREQMWPGVVIHTGSYSGKTAPVGTKKLKRRRQR